MSFTLRTRDGVLFSAEELHSIADSDLIRGLLSSSQEDEQIDVDFHSHELRQYLDFLETGEDPLLKLADRLGHVSQLAKMQLNPRLCSLVYGPLEELRKVAATAKLAPLNPKTKIIPTIVWEDGAYVDHRYLESFDNDTRFFNPYTIVLRAKGGAKLDKIELNYEETVWWGLLAVKRQNNCIEEYFVTGWDGERDGSSSSNRVATRYARDGTVLARYEPLMTSANMVKDEDGVISFVGIRGDCIPINEQIMADVKGCACATYTHDPFKLVIAREKPEVQDASPIAECQYITHTHDNGTWLRSEKTIPYKPVRVWNGISVFEDDANFVLIDDDGNELVKFAKYGYDIALENNKFLLMYRANRGGQFNASLVNGHYHILYFGHLIKPEVRDGSLVRPIYRNFTSPCDPATSLIRLDDMFRPEDWYQFSMSSTGQCLVRDSSTGEMKRMMWDA